MQITRGSRILLATAMALIGVVGTVLAYITERNSGPLAQGNMCTTYGATDVVVSDSASNPDTLLFVTCGGFLE